jgi:hypothetical protein
MLLETMKKKSQLLTEAIARAKLNEWEKKKQKADPLVKASKRNVERLAKSWERFYLK